MPVEGQDLIALTAEIVSAHVANNSVHTGEVASLIGTVFQALSQLGTPTEATQKEAAPQGATTARKSLSRSSHIISMIDGQPYKMLRRHLNRHGYTPETYRATFGLPKDYPMVAPDYSEQRRAVARTIGLGRKSDAGASATAAPGEVRSDAIVDGAVPPVKQARRKLKPAFSDAVAAAKGHLGGE